MPQHAKRLKVRRKDLRKPDEFETLTGQVVDWADANRSIVGAIVTGVLVVAAIVLGVARWRASRNETASADFQAAHARLTAGAFDEAARGFDQVAAEYPHAPFGRLAGLYRAHALARSGDAAGAATAYAEYLAGSPPANYLRQEALTGLARAKEASGDTKAALDTFTQAGAVPGPFRTDALLAAARLHEAAGEHEQAVAIYKSLLPDAADPELKAFLESKVPPDARAAAAATTEKQADAR
jgi:predicted negative regulator of RcsB-dependent stress response